MEFEAKQSVTNLKWADKQGPARPKWHAFTVIIILKQSLINEKGTFGYKSLGS